MQEYIRKDSGSFYITFVSNISPITLGVDCKYLEKYKSLLQDNKSVYDLVLDIINSEGEWFTLCADKLLGGKTKYIHMSENREMITLHDNVALLYPSSYMIKESTKKDIASFINISNLLFSTQGFMNMRIQRYASKELIHKLFYNFSFEDYGRGLLRRFNDRYSIEDLKPFVKTDEIKKEQIHVVGVRFLGSSSGCYYYLGDNNIYNIGDVVLVNTSNNGQQTAKVVFRKIYDDQKLLPYPKSQLKSIIRKV